MAERKELNAQIDRPRGMAAFGADLQGSSLAADELKTGIEARLEKVMALTAKLRTMHDELAGDVHYVSKTTEKGERGGGAGANWWPASEREDAMAIL
jgi:hypothetical protein